MTGSVSALFEPRNIVIMGASDRNWSVRVHGNLARLGFPGAVHLVNPNRKELWGQPCYASLSELPEAPDHLAIFLPADDTIAAIDSAGEYGARSASLFAAGFGEGGDAEGKARALRLKAALTKSNIAGVGPNCMGLSVGRSRFATIPDEQLDLDEGGSVALITQSGMLMQTLSRGLKSGGCAISYMISCGNQTGLTFSDYFRQLALDDDLRVIACYVESIPDGPKFFEAAAIAHERGKTIVVTKIGGSEKSRRAALAHTGALAGNLKAFDVLAREAGMIRAENIEDLVDSAIVLAKHPRPRGNRVGVVTNSGAIKSLSTETAEALSIALPELSAEAGAAIRRASPDVEPSNPLDTKRTLTAEQYVATIAAVHDDPSVDAVLVAAAVPRAAGLDRKLKNFYALDDYIAKHATKPVVCFSPVTADQSEYTQTLRTELSHTTWLRDLNKSLRVVSRLGGSARPPLTRHAGCDQVEARRLLEKLNAASPTRTLSEAASKGIVRLFGVATPREFILPVADLDRLPARLSDMRFPVVAKAVAPAVAHKSDAGLVLLELRDADATIAAARSLVARCAELDVTCEGVLIAEMLKGGVEVVVGMHRDPESGPVVMFGAGGVLLELIGDVTFGPPGLDAARARDMVASTRVARLLDGFRGAPKCDTDALVDCIVAMGRLAAELGDTVESVEINPLLVRPDGAYALDALIVCRDVEH